MSIWGAMPKSWCSGGGAFPQTHLIQLYQLCDSPERRISKCSWDVQEYSLQACWRSRHRLLQDSEPASHGISLPQNLVDHSEWIWYCSKNRFVWKFLLKSLHSSQMGAAWDCPDCTHLNGNCLNKHICPSPPCRSFLWLMVTRTFFFRDCTRTQQGFLRDKLTVSQVPRAGVGFRMMPVAFLCFFGVQVIISWTEVPTMVRPRKLDDWLKSFE